MVHDKNVHIDVQLVKSADMPADEISRPPLDRGDYTLDMHLFQKMWFRFRPFLTEGKYMIDMFASPGNCKFQKFVSRLPHWEAWG